MFNIGGIIAGLQESFNPQCPACNMPVITHSASCDNCGHLFFDSELNELLIAGRHLEQRALRLLILHALAIIFIALCFYLAR